MRIALAYAPSDPAGRPPRRAAKAVVEFALLLPFFAALIVGMLEMGRAIIVKEILSDAAQKGCRTGALAGKSNTDVTADVNNILSTDKNISGTTTTILVNGQAADVGSATTGDQISVKVSVPFANATWTTTFFLSGQTIESEAVVMMKQG
jgi:Flp pilus assembly protein TadG